MRAQGLCSEAPIANIANNALPTCGGIGPLMQGSAVHVRLPPSDADGERLNDGSMNDGNPHDRVGSDIEFSLLDGVHDERMNDGNPHDRVGPDMEFSLLDGVHDERRINGNPHDRVGLDMEFSLLDGVHDDRMKDKRE